MPCVDPSSMRSGNAAVSLARVSFLGVIECDLARCQAEAIAGGARRRLDPTPRRMVPVQHVVQGPGPRPRRKARDDVMGGRAMLDLLIRGGDVVTPQGVGRWDVAIEGERIVALGLPELGLEAGRVIDATGKIGGPGGIEPHTHLPRLISMQPEGN